MNIPHARKNADRFHKTALLLASKITGLPAAEFFAGRVKVFPIIVGDGLNRLAIFYQGRQQDGDSDFITPYVVNAAFSLELYLKLLRHSETNAWPRGHMLKNLYQQLTQPSKDNISSYVVNLVSGSQPHNQIALAITQQENLPFSWDVESLIEHSSNAFVSWRYAFESHPGWFAGYNEIRNAIVNRIDQLENHNC